jgi:hypothetical protein
MSILEKEGPDVMLFPQDEVSPHFYIAAWEFLDYEFPLQWFGRSGSITWPPRSPDLTPLDFFFWGYMKNGFEIVYSVYFISAYISY